MPVRQSYSRGPFSFRRIRAPCVSHILRIGLVDLFAGIGGLRRALELLGLTPDVPILSETSDTAVRVLLYQWPDSIVFLSVFDISEDVVRDLARCSMHVDVWIIGGGFECHPFSSVSVKHSAFSADSRADLCSYIPFVADLVFFIGFPGSQFSKLAKTLRPCIMRPALSFQIPLPFYATRRVHPLCRRCAARAFTGSIGPWRLQMIFPCRSIHTACVPFLSVLVQHLLITSPGASQGGHSKLVKM